MSIKLSIIVPIYNVEAYLIPCLTSVAEAVKVLGNCEVICVCDGATDASEQIIRSFCNRHHAFRGIFQGNEGYGRAVNRGLDESIGEYVTIVESDDVILPEAYPRLLSLLDSNSELDFVKTPYFVWESGILTRKVGLDLETLRVAEQPMHRVSESSQQVVYLDSFKSSDLIFMSPSIWSAVYRRSALEAASIRVLETPGASYQDTYFSTLLFLRGLKHAYVDHPYYMYRYERPDSSRNTKIRVYEMSVAFDSIVAAIRHEDCDATQKMQYLYALYFKRLIWFFGLVAPGGGVPCFHN